MKKILIASHNEGKIKEFRDILEPLGLEVVSAAELNVSDVEETGKTFEENAALKAEAMTRETGFACIADDSGLCVNALSGRPGVYSARYAPDRDFGKGMDMILEEIAATGSEDRSAYFMCVLALAVPGGEVYTFEGKVDGNISLEKRGDRGFGYDKIFVPKGYDLTFGELSKEEKNALSHRGRALQKFVEFMKTKNG
ncbi:MAG: RdgB/HAM1 family non-canonical purine NTP pyrophosphatase [Lactobacillaceae bacterium]|jgi:XTP/dITP diphosphohydrolase|nr:RdgB/HAM1 family non-canonical purine NTP pyrophosphatase [Lactobacillaceae bacterium]